MRYNNFILFFKLPQKYQMDFLKHFHLPLLIIYHYQNLIHFHYQFRDLNFPSLHLKIHFFPIKPIIELLMC
jgi:hypothetical protein